MMLHFILYRTVFSEYRTIFLAYYGMVVQYAEGGGAYGTDYGTRGSHSAVICSFLGSRNGTNHRP